MANTIGRAGSTLNIRLGQSPDIKDPALNYEMQLIFNSLHLLSQYMAVLRENLESAPGQNPAESVRFRRTFWAEAAQDIVVGAVVSSYNSKIVNGVAASLTPYGSVYDPAVTVGSTGSRRRFNVRQEQSFIALTAASIGQVVQVGVGPGIIQVNGAKCGKLVWGVSALSIDAHRKANTPNQLISPGVLVNNGGIYLDNILGRIEVPAVWYNWEGYWLPGYPNNSGGTYYYRRAFLYPIGVCVSDGFVLFSDYKRSDPLPDQSF